MPWKAVSRAVRPQSYLFTGRGQGWEGTGVRKAQWRRRRAPASCSKGSPASACSPQGRPGHCGRGCSGWAARACEARARPPAHRPPLPALLLATCCASASPSMAATIDVAVLVATGALRAGSARARQASVRRAARPWVCRAVLISGLMRFFMEAQRPPSPPPPHLSSWRV